MTRTNKGFTLIEMAVVLAIIAILAAILTPMVTNYLDQARIARAQADVRTIADSIKLHHRDTGHYPVYNSKPDAAANTALGGARQLLHSATGADPGLTVAGGWNGLLFADSSLELYVNNDFEGSGNAAFPKAGFRGPYLGAVDSDPWGNKYVVTGLLLAGSVNHSYVISAGPNGNLDITYAQPKLGAFTMGATDDIAAVIE